MVTAMVLVCRLELAVYLLQRVLRRGKDDRFDNVRGNFFSFLGAYVEQCRIPHLGLIKRTFPRTPRFSWL